MTTERLSILIAAAALREFTAPELAAYTGANPKTVRQVLHREQQSRGLFERSEQTLGAGKGRRPVLWRLRDGNAVLDELAYEESRVAELQAASSSRMQRANATPDWADRTEALLTSAEEAAERSVEDSDVHEQKALADIAINLLHAADPDPHAKGDQTSPINWWEDGQDLTVRRARVAKMRPPEDNPFGIIRLRYRSSGAGPEQVLQRACRVAAFASLGALYAEGVGLGAEHLKRATEAVAAGSDSLPPSEAFGWVRLIVRASTNAAIGYLPPIAVLMPDGQSPANLFPTSRGRWRRVAILNKPSYVTYAVWVEEWTVPLWASELLPGLVMFHDGSTESSETLNQLLAGLEGSTGNRAAVIIASASENFKDVAKVSQSGGIFYPIRETLEGLLETVSRAVIPAVDTASDPSVDHSAGNFLRLASPPIVHENAAPTERVSDETVVRQRHSTEVDNRPTRSRSREVEETDPEPSDLRVEQQVLFGVSPELGYRGPTACAAAGITYRQLDYWARTGLVEPTLRVASGSGRQRLYSFRDILVLKIVKRLLDTGISLQQIRVAVTHLRDRGSHDLSQVTLLSDGESIYEATSPDEVVDLLAGGQGIFGIAVGRVWQELEGTLIELPREKVFAGIEQGSNRRHPNEKAL